MEYREAQKIRKKSFGTLLAEQEGGLGTSLKKTISLKSQAKAKGIKQTFDPMNIAKFMTFGSNWAPAMMGKATGRKQEDVNFFTGARKKGEKAEQVPPGEKATKIPKLSRSSGGLDKVLEKIFSLMNKSFEDENTRREEKNNYKEENELEKLKRHKELVEAITGKPYKGKATATKVKEDSGASMLEMLLGGRAMVSTLMSVLSWFAGPVGIALLGAASIAALAYLLINDKNADETNKGILNAGQTDGGLGAAIQEVRTDEVASRKAVVLREAHKKGIIKASWYEFDKQGKEEKEYLKSIGFDDKTGLIQKDRDNGFNAVDEDGNPYRSETRAKEENQKSQEMPSEANTNPGATAPTSENNTNNNTQENSGATATVVKETPAVTAMAANATQAPTAQAPAASPSPTTASASESPTSSTSAPAATPMESPNAGAKLNTASATNQELQIPDSKPDVSTKVTNTQVATSSATPPPKPHLPPVRNMEASFRKMILASTRIV